MNIKAYELFDLLIFLGGRGSNSKPYIFYALSLPIELRSRGQSNSLIDVTIYHLILCICKIILHCILIKLGEKYQHNY